MVCLRVCATVLNLPGFVTKLSVGNGKNVAILTQDKSAHLWRGGKWEKLAGQFADISIGSDGDLWAVDDHNGIHHWVNGNWVRIGGVATAVGVGNKSNVVCCNRNTGKMFALHGDAWVEVMGVSAHHCDVGPDGVFVACNPQEVYFGRI